MSKKPKSMSMSYFIKDDYPDRIRTKVNYAWAVSVYMGNRVAKRLWDKFSGTRKLKD